MGSGGSRRRLERHGRCCAVPRTSTSPTSGCSSTQVTEADGLPAAVRARDAAPALRRRRRRAPCSWRGSASLVGVRPPGRHRRRSPARAPSWPSPRRTAVRASAAARRRTCSTRRRTGGCGCGRTASTAARGAARRRRWASGGRGRCGRCAARSYAPLPEPRLARRAYAAPFLPGSDDEAWLAVNAAAFADHPDQGGWTAARPARADARSRGSTRGASSSPRTSGRRRLVGFHWTKVHGADAHQHGQVHEHAACARGRRDARRAARPSARTSTTTTAHEPIGEVYVVGIDPAHRGLAGSAAPSRWPACSTCGLAGSPTRCSTSMPRTPRRSASTRASGSPAGTSTWSSPRRTDLYASASRRASAISVVASFADPGRPTTLKKPWISPGSRRRSTLTPAAASLAA